MVIYKVIEDFTDLEDENHVYTVGDKYPRKGRVKKARAEALSTPENRRKEPVIEVVEEPEKDGDNDGTEAE